MNEWPNRTEIVTACANLWTGDPTQHIATVTKVLGEIQNIRNQEDHRG